MVMFLNATEHIGIFVFWFFFVTHKTLHCSYSMLNSNFLIVAYITYQQSMYP